MVGIKIGRGFQAVLTLLSVAAATLSFVETTPAQEAATATPTAAAGDALLGEWWTENNDGRVKFARYKDGTYRGTTTCCIHKNDPKNPEFDTENPNPALRNRSMLGVVLIWNLKFEDGEWVEGHVYNPRDGKTYRMKIAKVDRDTIKIRGYMGIELLGQTQVWKRAQPGSTKPATAAN